MTEINKSLEKKLNLIAVIITIAVLFLVGMMRRVKIPTDIDFSFLPAVHASANGIVALSLLFAFYQIRKKNIEAHRKAIYNAMFFSLIFLLSYVTYHFTTEETAYCKEGFIRNIYFFILISHIILAGAIFPFIMFTFIRAYTGQFDRHRRMARWVFPIWLYVSVTGLLVYFMIKPCY